MKLRRELRPGTRIVSNAFGIGNWRPDATGYAPDGSTMLLWTVPRAPARAPDVEFVPTTEAVAYEMLQLAGATARDVVYDLGSGDGRIPILAAQKYGARGVGIELDPRLVEISREVARDGQLADMVTFTEADLFDADISSATIVTLYLSASVNARLEAKLRRDLRPGTRIVSHEFPIGAWPPEKTVRASDGTACSCGRRRRGECGVRTAARGRCADYDDSTRSRPRRSSVALTGVGGVRGSCRPAAPPVLGAKSDVDGRGACAAGGAAPPGATRSPSQRESLRKTVRSEGWTQGSSGTRCRQQASAQRYVRRDADGGEAAVHDDSTRSRPSFEECRRRVRAWPHWARDAATGLANKRHRHGTPPDTPVPRR